MTTHHETTVATDRAKTMSRIETLAEIWGAEWRPDDDQSGHLALPVRAGLRRGLVEGPVLVTPDGQHSRVRFDIQEQIYRVQYSAFFLLTLGAVGGILTVAAPLVPTLWPLVPVGVILAVASWLLIVSRLHNSGPEQFFEELGALEAEPAGENGE